MNSINELRKLLDVYNSAIITSEHHYDFITHISEADFGYSLYLMESEGHAFARIYWYNNDCDSLCISDLHVSDYMRKTRYGSDLMKIFEFFGKEFSFNDLNLLVKKDSWVHDWYLRLGYADTVDCEDNKELVWMKKSINGVSE